MSEEFRHLLIIVAVCVPTGLALGIAIRKTRPNWCKSYARFCMNRKWWLFAFGIVMFLGASIMTFASGRRYHAALFLLFACLNVFALVRYGFKRLTPEQEAQIDASDPTKLWPISYWKRGNVGGEGATTHADGPRR